MITVVIVEDNKNIGQLLEHAINSHEDYSCLARFESAEAAVKGIPDLLPDVVLMDIGLPQMNGIEAVRQLKPVCPNVEFMMCTVYDEDENVFKALEAGANAYILKRSGHEELLQAIRDLYEGGSPMSSDIARKVVQKMQQTGKTDVRSLYGITKREEEILGYLAKGLLYREIANTLFISEKTMKKHIYNIYEKMHVNSKVEALNKYYGR
ncbi:MAG: response regulator transcription factor [Chitinophagaceae bacterium]|nr:response regulator transcription factor [Chitinophagaceae bacterium]